MGAAEVALKPLDSRRLIHPPAHEDLDAKGAIVEGNYLVDIAEPAFSSSHESCLKALMSSASPSLRS